MPLINGVKDSQAAAVHRRARRELLKFQVEERERLLEAATKCNKLIDDLVRLNGEDYRPNAERAAGNMLRLLYEGASWQPEKPSDATGIKPAKKDQSASGRRAEASKLPTEAPWELMRPSIQSWAQEGADAFIGAVAERAHQHGETAEQAMGFVKADAERHLAKHLDEMREQDPEKAAELCEFMRRVSAEIGTSVPYPFGP